MTEYSKNTNLPITETEYKKRCEQGERAELNILDIMPNIEHIKYKYNYYDFINHKDKYILECKSRNNTKDFYQTTIIPLSKITKFKKSYLLEHNYEFIFIFKFLDGIFYHILDINKEYNVKSIFNRCHIEVPTSELFVIENLVSKYT